MKRAGSARGIQGPFARVCKSVSTTSRAFKLSMRWLAPVQDEWCMAASEMQISCGFPAVPDSTKNGGEQAAMLISSSHPGHT